MITLPPLPPIEVQPIDIEIQAPNVDADALRAVMSDLYGIHLDEQQRILTLQPNFPLSWKGENVGIATADFEFSIHYVDTHCTWYFEGFGDFAERYDSIVVYTPAGTLLAGELADSEGVSICYLSNEQEEISVADIERKLTRKERKELARQEKERKKLEKAQAKKKK